MSVIQYKIYRNIEDCETWKSIIKVIQDSLQPYLKLLKYDFALIFLFLGLTISSNSLDVK